MRRRGENLGPAGAKAEAQAKPRPRAKPRPWKRSRRDRQGCKDVENYINSILLHYISSLRKKAFVFASHLALGLGLK